MLIAYEKNILIFYFVCFKLYSGGRKTTHKIVILDPKNRDSLVAKFFSDSRSPLVTLYFWFYVKNFSRLSLGSKLLGKEQNNFTCNFS